MTLYEFSNVTMLQGNIEIKICDMDGNARESRSFKEQQNFNCFYNNCNDIKYYKVCFVYSNQSADGTPWVTIELMYDFDDKIIVS